MMECALHLVDEGSIERFVACFLGRSRATPPLPDALLRIDRVRRMLRRAPDRGARALIELCLDWCAADAPHVSSCNFALSLWHDEEIGVPLSLCTTEISLEPMLADIVAVYPEIRGRFFLGFDERSAGYFVRASHVPELRAHVEASLDRLPRGQQAAGRRLLRILSAAEHMHLAYWEADHAAGASSGAATKRAT